MKSFRGCPIKQMSEFKFACPVCGQHITADSSTTGSQLECPTCYRKIVVPQAPSAGESKFVVSASEANKPRPPATTPESGPIVIKKQSPWPYVAGVALLVLIAGAVATVVLFRDKILKKTGAHTAATAGTATNAGKSKTAAPVAPARNYSVPTNISYTLELDKAAPGDAPAAGQLHGKGFYCERAIMQGGHLTLRQGSGQPADLGVTIQFFAQLGEELSGKTIEVSADRDPPQPIVVLRWKGDNDKAATKRYPSGYALKAVFGVAENKRIPGAIYLALPDEDKSFVSGTFVAEIRKPPAPKTKTPKTPKAPKASG
jgi:DNA-directed RNA polymerase subunit RPC12/RpoP